jgi:VCBS repeat-containing protein
MASKQKLTDKRWRVVGTVAAVAATTTAGGVAWATTNADPTPSPSAAASPSAPNSADPGKPGGPAGKGRHGAFGIGGALHGEFTVEKDGGGYQTVATQNGEVTAVSKDSITVKSADGYSRTYTVTADTLVNATRDGISSIKNGNTVSVQATVADGKATAARVSDGTQRDAAREKWGFKRGPR